MTRAWCHNTIARAMRGVTLKSQSSLTTASSRRNAGRERFTVNRERECAQTRQVRATLGDAGMAGSVDLSLLASQNGLFSVLPVTPDQVKQLREEHAIYMAGSGRVNIAGLHMGNIEKFVKAIAAVTG